MYIIKEQAEDFQVDELFNPPGDQGRYTYFRLWKKNYTTVDAIQMVSKRFHIPLKKIGFAGNKDKKAVTTQLCSVEGAIKNWEVKDLRVEVLGKSDEPITLGKHLGNRFALVIRGIDHLPTVKEQFINTFGEQRFSTSNVEIGRALVKRNFERAVGYVTQKSVQEYLEKHPKNFIGALRTLPKKILRLYVHSYQSFLWNIGVKKCLPGETFPILGFGTELEGKSKKIYEVLMKAEGITQRDFIFKEIPEISAEGGSREIFVQVSDVRIGVLEDDELHPGKKKVNLSFSLPPGCYATEYVKQLF